MTVQRYSWTRSLLALAACALVPACAPSTPGPQGTGGPPSFGGLVSATPSTTTPGEIDLTWAPASASVQGTITYQVFYAEGLNSGKEKLQFTKTNSNGVAVTGLISHEPYLFIVQAEDALGNTDGNSVEREAIAP